MFSIESENSFYVRSDGSFTAHFGDVILKAVKSHESHVYPFEAIASTGAKDIEGQTLLQKGLNFDPFKLFGKFNWNHMSQTMTGFPTGKKAWYDAEGGFWKCEGEIVGGMPILPNFTTDMMVSQHNALKKAGIPKGLCVSIEGKVREKSKDGRFVMKADIYNIAHTFQPINQNCSLSFLAKSFAGQIEVKTADGFYKALDEAKAEPMVKQDLEGAGDDLSEAEEKLVRHLVSKGFTLFKAKAEVYNYLSKKFPTGRIC